MFHFTATFANNTTVFAASVEMNRYSQASSNALHAALEAGRIMRAEAAAQGIFGYMTVSRASAPVVTDEHAATREMGRKMGLNDAQIEAFIARQAA